MKIHKDENVPCRKRLYMTATQKIYSSNAKQDAKEVGWSVYSMDDESIYGPVFHYLSFGDAITKNLLTDYRLIVLNVREKDVAALNLPGYVGKLDTASKIVGSLAALSKIPSKFSPDEFKEDPEPMRRSVAFCSGIREAKLVAEAYSRLQGKDCLGAEYMEKEGYVIPEAKWITGADKTVDRNKKLNWLRDENIPEGTCRILTNARCLSEGVDVPSLDSIIFFAKKRSQVDIIQAVGRVMRKFGSGGRKKYGYIIIPVVIGDEKKTNEILNNSEDYKVVWRVVQALRSHDERLDAQINRIGVNGGKLPGCICILDAFFPPRSRSKKGTVGVSASADGREGADSDAPGSEMPFPGETALPMPSPEDIKERDRIFAGQLVKHCGDRLYWEDWSKDIGDVSNSIAIKIRQQIDSDDSAKKAFNRFLREFRKLLNPHVTEEDAIDMLAEHVVTLPVLKALFSDQGLIDQNPVTQIMESMVKKLSNLSIERDKLEPFYESVRKNVEGIDTSEGRQEIIRKLFEKFFQYAMPKSAEKFGIVYTPVEIVDFIINSVSDVLKSEFNESITSPGIKILDPFTGTGTFIVRLLDKLKKLGISDQDLKSKYENDIWCNEIMLLAYYIALVNIEDTYGRLSSQYEAFSHAVLTDTFQLAEKKKGLFYQTTIFEDEEFKTANSKAREEDSADIRIIVGNPPYSVGQKNANDNNANEAYPYLDQRIRDTYVKGVKITNNNSLYDSYVRAFRWASDRLGDDGIISFVSNGSYVDNLAFSGFRRELLKEFNHVYVFNLRGNQRTQGELSRREGGKIFGSGSRNTICIIVLVKHRGKPYDGFVHYRDIGDYLTREQKLNIVKNSESVSHMDWEEIYPDENHDWINKTDPSYGKLLLLGSKDSKGDESAVFSGFYSRGIQTGKDAWTYNFSRDVENDSYSKYVKEYEKQLNSATKKMESNYKAKLTSKDILQYIEYDDSRIKWDREILTKFTNRQHLLGNGKLIHVSYRPFCKKWMAYDPQIIQMNYKWVSIMPIDSSGHSDNPLDNLSIIIPGIGDKREFSALVSDDIIDLHVIGASQCFPLYWYTKGDGQSQILLGSQEQVGDYIRDNSIDSSIVELFQRKYGDSSIDHRAIFNYIYGLFHSREYKSKYSNNLAKEMPRIPFLKDFWGYSNTGKKLIDLHLNYESAPAYQGVNVVKTKDDYTVTKIRYPKGKDGKKDDKSIILFNDFIRIEDVPLEAYEYVVNGRSPIDWVQDQYQYSVDKDSGIVDDPNLYDTEKGGKYVFDLILSLITVSLETLKLIDQLPKYEEI